MSGFPSLQQEKSLQINPRQNPKHHCTNDWLERTGNQAMYQRMMIKTYNFEDQVSSRV
jgi:hypothetical protein